jgi:hypothetical protein
MLPADQKDDLWAANVLDFIEWQGIRQLRTTAPKLLKYYKAAKGIIDRTDYIPTEDNEMSDMVDLLSEDTQTGMELRFYPIIPTIIDCFRTEFSKRRSKLIYYTTDEQSLSELEQDKKSKLEEILIADAEFRMVKRLRSSGADFGDPEVQKQLQPDVLKQLPELQEFYRTSYRDIYAEWAQKQQAVDDKRFHMNELEDMAFIDNLATDREFWHFRMKEDDYEPELWSTLLTAYHKSPGERWMSNASWIVNYDVMTVPDVIDKLGWLMTAEQMESLEQMHPVRAAMYTLDMPNDGSYYDNTQSYEWNTQGPSLGMRQYMSRHEFMNNHGDVVLETLLNSEDLQTNDRQNTYIRVSTVYWKTQRKFGELTKIVPGSPVPIKTIIDETYKVVDKPIYDTTVYKEKTKRNLVFGEHIDWFWANEVWGGYKVGPNRPSWFGMNNPDGFEPIYLGLNGGKPGRLPFQFKGDDNIWGVKLPVEGAVFSDRHTISVPMVGRLLPYQIGFNMVHNKIDDIRIDEMGSVLIIDQNTIPKHSMGEDWDFNNFVTTMRQYNVAVLDHSTKNIQGTGQFNQTHVADLSQTNRILGLIQQAEYLKKAAFESIGFNAQRLGQPIAQEQSAKGFEEALNRSYDQTEMYFTQHCDHLMPRVHQMRTELAQYYNSTNPSVTLQYVTDNNMRETFRIDGTKLLLRDINVMGVTEINARQVLAQVKQKMMNDNTTGTGIAFAKVLKADNLAELDKVVHEIEMKMEQNQRAQLEEQKRQHEAELEQEMRLKQMEWDHSDAESEKERLKDVLIARIQAASRAADAEDPQAGVDAYQEELDSIQAQSNFQEEMNFKKIQHLTKTDLERQKLDIQRQKVDAENARTREELVQHRVKEAALKKQKDAKKK